MPELVLGPNLLEKRLGVTSFRDQGGGVAARPYKASDALATAAGLAVMLSQPLLLSGLPGVGKTGAAYYIAEKLGCGPPVRQTVTTRTTGRDLLYSYDALSLFHDKRNQPLRNFLRFEALGQAIVRSWGSEGVVFDSATDSPVTELSRIVSLVGDGGRDGAGPLTLGELLPAGQRMLQAGTSVVLIDEIDKAPRDTPNDLLESFEAMSFTIDELGLKIGVGDGRDSAARQRRARPVVVATTNAENNLPDAFLRRCIFHEITMPDPDRIKLIVGEHLMKLDGKGSTESRELADAAVEVGGRVAGLVASASRPPGTAEYIALARTALALEWGPGELRGLLQPQGANRALLPAVLGVFVKTADDVARAMTSLGAVP